jgi:glycosyltransferase involved in cell wall biosynthesis
MTRARLAYVSFDTVPAPKGAATHIEAFVRSLAEAFGGVDLVTVAAGESIVPTEERWPGIFHTEIPALGKTLIDRTLCFRRFVAHWLETRRFEAIQFRSIFEGLPLTELAHGARLIFEVNGLPSIELKYRYPGAEDDRELMRKVIAQEQACLDAAHLVITPSGITREYLVSSRGVPAEKVRVIPNGVDVRLFRPSAGLKPKGSGTGLIYFGTLSAWQGVELAIRALAQVCSQARATLTVIGAASGRERDALLGLAAKLGVVENIAVLPPVTQAELAGHLGDADVSLAPLTLNDRNLVQGCCPLKILESMAAGVPVIASDLPVVRELGEDGEHFLLVKPGSVDQIAEAVLRLVRESGLAAKIAEQGRAHAVKNYTWKRAGDALVAAYEEVGITRSSIA